jgi:hypothetical protein
VAEYQKYVTMPACIYNLLEYPEHGGGKLLFNSGIYVPINTIPHNIGSLSREMIAGFSVTSA